MMTDAKPSKTHFSINTAIVGTALLLTGYLSAYYLNAYPEFRFRFEPVRQRPAVGYEYDGPIIRALFTPAHYLDTWIRPHTWEEREM
jgi:hypothetical protein